jgi:hypothetical protein
MIPVFLWLIWLHFALQFTVVELQNKYALLGDLFILAKIQLFHLNWALSLTLGCAFCPVLAGIWRNSPKRNLQEQNGEFETPGYPITIILP